MIAPSPDFTSLHCFLTLADHLNFRSSAEAVALSPAAFSDRIKRLEEEIGRALFERTTRTVKLTPFGARLRPHASRLLEEGRRFMEATRTEGLSSPYRLRLGTRFELGMSWLLPSLTELKRCCPERSIELIWGTDQDLLSKLKQGQLDAFISSVRMNVGPLRTTTLHREDYILVAAPQVVQNDSRQLSSVDVAELTLIDLESSLPLFRYLLDVISTEEVWQFKNIEFMGTIGAVRARVLEGVGVAVLPLYFVKQEVESGELVHLCPDLKLVHDFFRLIWHTDQPLVQELIQLAETLRTFPLR